MFCQLTSPTKSTLPTGDTDQLHTHVLANVLFSACNVIISILYTSFKNQPHQILFSMCDYPSRQWGRKEGINHFHLDIHSENTFCTTLILIPNVMVLGGGGSKEVIRS